MLLENYIKNYLLTEKKKMSNKVINYKHNKDNIKFGDLHAILLLASDARVGGKASNFVIKSAFRFLSSTVSAATLGTINVETLGEITVDAFVDKLKEKNIIDLKKYSPEELLKKFYGINKEKGLEFLEVPENVSLLIDDKIENAFIKQLYSVILKKPKDEIIEKDFVLGELKKFTKEATGGAWALNK
tara:strand:- start:3465 stop:4025 length:561 start_codon:yes stop_codon:yes gene_type:complete